MAARVTEIWRYGEIDVMYERHLEGAGRAVTPPLLDFVRSFCGDQHFSSALDCFAGVGFIGLGLVAEGLCDSITLADIDAKAIDYARQNIVLNKLEGRAHAYVSDNFAAFPRDARFDVVVANPPWYWQVDRSHPLFPLLKSKLDVVSEDSGWRIHQAFYRDVGAFLNPGALLFVLEGDPNRPEVVLCGQAFDKRPAAPASLFHEMMRQGGLEPVSDHHIWSDPFGGEVWAQVSRKALR